jgi:hypothetical protein
MHAEIQFGSRVHMLPLPKNHILKCRKKLAKNLHVHIHNICSFVKFHEKPIFFVVYVKKRKLILWKALFLVLCFIFLHTSHDKSQLCKGVAREDVHANFLFHFFLKFKICVRCISKWREHMLLCFKTPLPHAHDTTIRSHQVIITTKISSHVQIFWILLAGDCSAWQIFSI